MIILLYPIYGVGLRFCFSRYKKHLKITTVFGDFFTQLFLEKIPSRAPTNAQGCGRRGLPSAYRGRLPLAGANAEEGGPGIAGYGYQGLYFLCKFR
jgi:hypothetical protein